ncbi:MAG: pseudouridine synthase [Butyrivibrio sp.]|nr:pseudouridine synthase [Butyrivibrio sp.]
MDSEKIRLNKYIALCGVCSRRDADVLIEQGKVTVNGAIAENGVKIGDGDLVLLEGKALSLPKEHVVLAYNKPVGVTCTEKDEHAERTIIEDLNYDRRVTYAGRLDKDSEGLMILTDDGDLIQAMMKGINAHEKEYVVQVNKKLTDKFLKQLEGGVYLSDLQQTTRPCKTKRVSDDCFRIILTQGLNRQIRRMCSTFGYEVVKLKRVRIMNIELKGLELSEYRELRGEELAELYKLAGL